MKCILCGGSQLELITKELRDTTTHGVYKCRGCEHVQLWPRPTEKESKKFYDDNMQDKLSGLDNSVNRLHVDVTRRVDFMKEHFSNEYSILDVGTGYGHFVTEMRKAGFINCFGQERSKTRRTEGIIGDEITDIKDKYDVVTLFHVMEHVVNPIEIAKQVKALLKPGGVVIAESPNIHEDLMTRSKDYAKFNLFQSHLSYFNFDNFGKLFKRAGFDEVAVFFLQRYSVINAIHWVKVGLPEPEPTFIVTDQDVAPLDSDFRKKVIETGTSDTLWLVGRLK